jgi:hypothetical protein
LAPGGFTVHRLDRRITKKDAGKIKSVLLRVNEIAGRLRLPTETKIDLTYEQRVAATKNEWAVNQIYMALRLTDEKLPGVPASAPGRNDIHDGLLAEAVLAHEYAHGVFAANFSKGSQPFDKNSHWVQAAVNISNILSRHNQAMEATRKPLLEQLEKLEKVEEELRARADREKQNFWKIMTEDIPKVQAQSAALKKQLEELSPYEDGFDLPKLISPYDELFADTVAVLYSGDLSVISKAMTFPRASDEWNSYAQLRDFNRENTVADGQVRTHTLLSLTRTFIGKRLKQGWMQKPQELTKALHEAIESELMERSQDYDLLVNMDPQTVNERLIGRLRVLLKSQP